MDNYIMSFFWALVIIGCFWLLYKGAEIWFRGEFEKEEARIRFLREIMEDDKDKEISYEEFLEYRRKHDGDG